MVVLSFRIEFILHLAAKCINISSLLTESVVDVSGRKDSSLFRNLMLVLLLYCMRPRCGLCEARV